MHTINKYLNANALLIIGLILFLILLSTDTFAASGGSGLPWESWITKLKNSITGPVAFGVAVIAMVASGCVLIFGGEISGIFKSLLYLVMAMGLVVSGQNIVSTITGKGAEITPPNQSHFTEAGIL